MSEICDTPSATPEMLAHLGPLAALAGMWESKEGVDISPAKTGSKETHFRERITFEPIGPGMQYPSCHCDACSVRLFKGAPEYQRSAIPLQRLRKCWLT